MNPLLTATLAGLLAVNPVPASTWTEVPSPSPSTESNRLRGVSAVAADDVWSVGHSLGGGGLQRPLSQHWDGVSWKTVAVESGEDRHGTLTAVAGASPTDLWAVGSTATSVFDPDSRADPADPRPLILRGDGTRWTKWPIAGPGHLAAVDMFGSSEGWAVGSHVPAGTSVPRGLILRWTGRAWAQVPAPDLGPLWLTGVSVRSADDVWAVGYRGTGEAVALHWDGLEWQESKLGLDASGGTALYSVAAVSDREVWAVGYAWPRGKREGLALRFNGSVWERIPVDVTQEGTQFRGVVAVPGGVWAVGYYVDQVDTALIMSFDGTKFVKDPPPPYSWNHSGTAVSGVTATPAGELWAVGCKGNGTRILRRST
jgi:hypothetical protein